MRHLKLKVSPQHLAPAKAERRSLLIALSVFGGAGKTITAKQSIQIQY